jgi:RNA polymerase sigma-70 factor (ECF subfamily)
MSATDWKASEFEKHRRHLNAVAYRMLGSTTEADDAVQEAWLRLSRSDAGDVSNLAGWLTTVVARVCLDMLRVRQSRRAQDVDTWLPEPIVAIEEATDRQERRVVEALGDDADELIDLLEPWSKAVVASGGYPSDPSSLTRM